MAGLEMPPVDVFSVAQRLGAEARVLDLAPDVSSILYREGDRKVFVLTAAHSRVRQRFTVSHEIGHLMLHKGDQVHVDQGFRINLRDPRAASADDVEEIEANAFAASLLMPADWLKADLGGEVAEFEGMLGDRLRRAEVPSFHQEAETAVCLSPAHRLQPQPVHAGRAGPGQEVLTP